MGTKAERQAARDRVVTYHEAQLGELIEHVGCAVDRFRSGERDAFEVDAAIHQYHRAARQLWSFCAQSGAQVEATAHLIQRMADAGVGGEVTRRGEG
ncbi:hypothetical protein OG563_38340 [Nocardia vinacea]|uniref:Uncharacterized protein n=1 Tax=Nocardia vinacea TaxID=96468 RepID=A0ABZ1Z725_9NOCA|nr:hypothetical protein [Nocardia vinacea]